jgi:hypothetical protein
VLSVQTRRAPSTSSTRVSARHAESTHQTPRSPPSGRTTGLCGHDLGERLGCRPGYLGFDDW